MNWRQQNETAASYHLNFELVEKPFHPEWKRQLLVIAHTGSSDHQIISTTFQVRAASRASTNDDDTSFNNQRGSTTKMDAK
jgi:hypothetical protein